MVNAKGNAPRFKKDYPGRLIMLRQDAPEDHCGLFVAGVTVKIDRRIKAEDTKLGSWPLPGDGNAWWLRLEMRCRHCGAHHYAYIPEGWLKKGLVAFRVEE